MSGYEYNKKWILAYNKSEKFKAYTKARYIAKKKELLYEKLGEIFDVVEQKEPLQLFCERIFRATDALECKKIMQEAYDFIK